MRPSVSILIPTYNNGKFLLECIGSILRQSYHDYEIILIDDYSADGTDIIVEGLKTICGKKLRYFKNQNVQGLVSALNFGISKCRGEYIVRMDADDMMQGNRIQEQVSFLKEHADYAAVGSGMQVINKDGRYLKDISVNLDEETCSFMLLFHNTFAHPTMTLRADVLKKERYKKSFRYCEDYELWTRIARKYRMKNFPYIYNTYRVHEDNTSTNTEKVRLQCINVLKLHAQLLIDLGIDYTENELLLHFSLFNNDKKAGSSEDIRLWFDKVFHNGKLIERFGHEFVAKRKDSLMHRFALKKV